jgi:hypothetical protein
MDDEALEVESVFAPEEIPWEELAFMSTPRRLAGII